MSDDTLRLNPAERRSAHKAQRLKLWSGFAVTVLCLAGAVVSALFWTNVQDAIGLALVLSCLVAAVISPPGWVASRVFLVSVTAILLFAFCVANFTGLLSVEFTLTDFVMAWLGCWLVQMLYRKARLANNSALTFSESVAAHTFIHGADEFEWALGVELVRSRRHERVFCLVSLKLDKSLESVVGHDFTRLNEVLKDSLRWIDYWYLSPDPNELLLICPETDKEGVRVPADRLQAQFAHVFDATIAIGWAEFPGDCLTRSELLKGARSMSLNYSNYSAPQVVDALAEPSAHNALGSMESLRDRSLS